MTFHCCAGSLLGVKLSSESFPVGKVDFMFLYPMNFHEFLLANNNELLLKSFLDLKDSSRHQRETTGSAITHDLLWQQLKEYFITGGMPQVVREYLERREFALEARQQARIIQKGL